jgi:hypothetical protein
VRAKYINKYIEDAPLACLYAFGVLEFVHLEVFNGAMVSPNNRYTGPNEATHTPHIGYLLIMALSLNFLGLDTEKYSQKEILDRADL